MSIASIDNSIQPNGKNDKSAAVTQNAEKTPIPQATQLLAKSHMKNENDAKNHPFF